MPNLRLTRQERKESILLVLSIMVQHGKHPELTAYQIAEKIDLTASNHLYGLLADMVADGLLQTRWESLGARGDRTWYRLPDGSYVMPNEVRSILVKINGQTYQEVLF